MTERFDSDILINYWIESSDNDFKTMNDLFQTGNNHWALFMGHLVIEKLLKAFFVKEKQEYPPMIHDLRRIAEKAGLELESQKQVALDSISRFNINARYDDYKQRFFILCTNEFTAKWIETIKELRIWIKTKL